MQVTIIGSGYVGLTTGVCLSYLGHHVTCLDADPDKIKMLESGRVPIYREAPANEIAENLGLPD